jgi:autotransporter passenger strand-loop-strand repeat protein
LVGGAGNDIFVLGTGINFINGNGGNVLVELPGSENQYSFSSYLQAGQLYWSVKGISTFENNTLLSVQQLQFVDGTTAELGPVVNNDQSLNISSRNATIDATINSGGLEFVDSGGSALGTTINGGTLELGAGAVVDDVVFAGLGGGILQIDDLASAPGGVQQTDFHSKIMGFESSDIIKVQGFGNFPIINGVTPTYDPLSQATTLSLIDMGASVAILTLAGNYSTDSFKVTGDLNISGAVDVEIGNTTTQRARCHTRLHRPAPLPT